MATPSGYTYLGRKEAVAVPRDVPQKTRSHGGDQPGGVVSARKITTGDNGVPTSTEGHEMNEQITPAPGMPPATSIVHRDFSSPAGLASLETATATEKKHAA